MKSRPNQILAKEQLDWGRWRPSLPSESQVHLFSFLFKTTDYSKLIKGNMVQYTPDDYSGYSMEIHQELYRLGIKPQCMLLERRKKAVLSLSTSGEVCFPDPSCVQEDRHLHSFESTHRLNLLSSLACPLYTYRTRRFTPWGYFRFNCFERGENQCTDLCEECLM